MPHILKSTPAQTFLSMIVAGLIGQFIPAEIQSGFYTLSILIKDLLLFILPVAVFFFISASLSSFEKQGLALLLLLVVFEAVSNSLASMSAYGLSFFGQHLIPQALQVSKSDSLKAFFSLADYKPSFWRVEYGTILGAALGLVNPYFQNEFIRQCVTLGKDVSGFLFSKIFARIIPLFVFGFFLNLIQGSVLSSIFASSAQILLLMTFGILSYILLLFMMAGGSISKGFTFIKNALPAGLTAFSSMSSAATMPVTIAVTEKNLRNKSFASMLIPATTNIQQIGDCFCNVFLCCIILVFYGKGLPDPVTFASFLGVFILARFTTAGVIGGAIFIMLPIYQTYLGFNAEMTALILSFNMLLDPLITSANVMANSALCVIFERVWDFYKRLFSKLKSA